MVSVSSCCLQPRALLVSLTLSQSAAADQLMICGIAWPRIRAIPFAADLLLGVLVALNSPHWYIAEVSYSLPSTLNDRLATLWMNGWWWSMTRHKRKTFTHHSRSFLACFERRSAHRRPSCTTFPQCRRVCRTRTFRSWAPARRHPLPCPSYSAADSQNTRRRGSNWRSELNWRSVLHLSSSHWTVSLYEVC